jgi:SprT protein
MSWKPETIDGVLLRFPESARPLLRPFFDRQDFKFRITRPARSRLGSFRSGRKGEFPLIQVNSDLKEYSFLLVFLHELAHFEVHRAYGRKVKPHGPEWKTAYQNLARPFQEQGVFPLPLQTELIRYFRKTPATFHRDSRLRNALAMLEGGVPLQTLDDIPLNTAFTLMNGKRFVKLEKLRTRYKCYHPETRRYYLVPRSAEVITETQLSGTGS